MSKLTGSIFMNEWISLSKKFKDCLLFLGHSTPCSAEVTQAEAIILGGYLQKLGSAKEIYTYKMI